MIPDEILSHVIYLYILRSENFNKKKKKICNARAANIKIFGAIPLKTVWI